MWKYIVTWLIYEWVSIPCPDNIPGCLVDHGKSVFDRVDAKVFSNRDSAFTYYKLLNNPLVIMDEGRDSAKIDSIKLDYSDQSFLYTRKDKTFYFTTPLH